MASAPHLVQPTRPRRKEAAAPVEPARQCLASVRWQVHVPNSDQSIANTAVAGADVELLSGLLSHAADREHRPTGTLLLTFWIDRSTPEQTQREVLAVFSDDPAAQTDSSGVAAQRASFRFSSTCDSVSLDVCADRPVLRITHVSIPGKRQLMAWCHGIVHELLGLSGGQYRLDAVHTDRSLISRVTPHVNLTREAG